MDVFLHVGPSVYHKTFPTDTKNRSKSISLNFVPGFTMTSYIPGLGPGHQTFSVYLIGV